MPKGSRSRPCTVYLVVNAWNGKRYVGITARTPERRFDEHCSQAKRGEDNGAFHRAIRKYGRDAFIVEPISKHASVDEALAEEIRLIALWCPEYNSTKGGDGQLGRPMSKEGAAKVSAANKGNKYRLGQSHSKETRQRLRDAGLRDKEKWLQRSHLGPQACSRQVICLDDSVTFNSIASAARHYGLSAGALSELCNGKRFRTSLSGLHFAFCGD